MKTVTLSSFLVWRRSWDMSLSNVAAQSIHRNAHTVYKKKLQACVYFWRLVGRRGAHTGLTHVTSLALFFLFPSMTSLAHNLRTEANVASEEKRKTQQRRKETQRWTGQSEWRGNRAVGLLLHSGTLTTTTRHQNDTCIRDLTGLSSLPFDTLPL